MRKAKDVQELIGRRLGRLTILSFSSVRYTKCNRTIANCLCQCGGECHPQLSALLAGRVLSCGCWQIEKATKHGAWSGGKPSLTWASWRAMHDRISRRETYSSLGVCERWKDFEKFLEDMGDRPSSDYSIGRIDNSRGYSKENCRWETSRQQAGNRSNNRTLTFNGETLCLAEWARRVGLNKMTLYHRVVHRGWSVERALTEPVGHRE